MVATKKIQISNESEGKRGRGRPSKLSEQIIINGALALLVNGTVEELTLSRLAQSLGTSVMSLYNYFPNRDALLEAVANQAFSQLVLPKPGKQWQDNLLAWLWAVQNHFDQFPVVTKMMGWDKRIPAAWMRVTVPVIRELKALGLQGEDLKFAVNWFLSSATGLMLIEGIAPDFRNSASYAALGSLTSDEQDLLLEVRQFPSPTNREDLLNYGFQQIIGGLGPLLKGRKIAPSKKAIRKMA